MLLDRNYETCNLCPRACGVNRNKGQLGYCKQSATLKIARAALHMWEEPCISGMTVDDEKKTEKWNQEREQAYQGKTEQTQYRRGSGAVFFSGCQLGCVYCQNQSIAKGQRGEEITIERLSKIFLELQEKGAYNINLVTPSHFVPSIVLAIRQAKEHGLKLPIIYNTSSYEKTETIKMLEADVRVYLPDLKYISSETAKKYSYAADYPQVAKKAIAQMVEQAGALQFDEETSCITQGVIVRHLVLPGYVAESKKVIRYLYETYGDKIYMSIMNQYTPLPHVAEFPEINRKLTKEEYDEVVDYAIEIGVEQGFIQEGETAEESFIPEFDGSGVTDCGE